MQMNKYAETVNLIERRLAELTDYNKCSYDLLLEAEQYSLTAGGKHLRGLIVIETARLFGVDAAVSLDIACAIEMVHTYSLVHDDLPEMDNDDFRRGKPTCHIKYGSDIALLAGDALLTKAFSVISANGLLSDKARLKCVAVLSDACGEHGMLAGQTIDKLLEGKNADLSQINELHARKTGDMFIASVRLGCAVADVDGEREDALCRIMSGLGAAFQIKDDILDVISDQSTLGKPINSDKKSDKSTYVSILGLEGAQRALTDTINEARAETARLNVPFFDDLAQFFLSRNK